MRISRISCVLTTTFTILLYSLEPAGAASGTAIYATANCFVFQTDQGATLFERSGGDGVAEGQKVSGPLDEFGYQELTDEAGKEVMVGWVQDFEVKDDSAIEDFKKNCR